VFVFDDRYSYRMPVHFSGVPGSGLQNLRYDDVTAINIGYRTDRDRLLQYVPAAFELLAPVVDVGYQKCSGIHWMGGGYYSLIAFMTPVRHRASGVEGAYVLVIWENKTAPILGGREETGMPKIFAEIPDHHVLGERVTVHASHEGRVFLELALDLEAALTDQELTAKSAASRINQLGWRYIPNIGRPGAALSHATLYPVDATYLSGSRARGRIAWTKAEPQFNPAQAAVVNALADLPVLEYRECLYTKLATNLRGDLARELREE